jgi:hypothetical protein
MFGSFSKRPIANGDGEGEKQTLYMRSCEGWKPIGMNVLIMKKERRWH